MKNPSLYTFYEKTIIENIDLQPYGISNDLPLYDRVQKIYDIFKDEFRGAHNLLETSVFAEWLRGLPSVLTVPFNYSDILKNAEAENSPYMNAQIARDEAAFLERYWKRLALAFFTLKDNL